MHTSPRKHEQESGSRIRSGRQEDRYRRLARDLLDLRWRRGRLEPDRPIPRSGDLDQGAVLKQLVLAIEHRLEDLRRRGVDATRERQLREAGVPPVEKSPVNVTVIAATVPAFSAVTVIVFAVAPLTVTISGIDFPI